MYKIHELTGLNYFDKPEVRVIAHTQMDAKVVSDYMEEYGLKLDGRDDLDKLEFLPEFAGRHCYMSFGDNVGSKSNERYLSNITKHKHYSVLEHISITFLFRGVSRGFTAESNRHRHLSPSQFSTRYCKSKDMNFVVPVLMRDSKEDVDDYLLHCYNCLTMYRNKYHEIYNRLRKKKPGWSKMLVKKRSRGAARSFLPIGLEAPIIVSGNLRAWREYIEKRSSKFAEEEIREVAILVYDHLKKLINNGVKYLWI